MVAIEDGLAFVRGDEVAKAAQQLLDVALPDVALQQRSGFVVEIEAPARVFHAQAKQFARGDGPHVFGAIEKRLQLDSGAREPDPQIIGKPGRGGGGAELRFYDQANVAFGQWLDDGEQAFLERRLRAPINTRYPPLLDSMNLLGPMMGFCISYPRTRCSRTGCDGAHGRWTHCGHSRWPQLDAGGESPGLGQTWISLVTRLAWSAADRKFKAPFWVR